MKEWRASKQHVRQTQGLDVREGRSGPVDGRHPSSRSCIQRVRRPAAAEGHRRFRWGCAGLFWFGKHPQTKKHLCADARQQFSLEFATYGRKVCVLSVKDIAGSTCMAAPSASARAGSEINSRTPPRVCRWLSAAAGRRAVWMQQRGKGCATATAPVHLPHLCCSLSLL